MTTDSPFIVNCYSLAKTEKILLNKPVVNFYLPIWEERESYSLHLPCLLVFTSLCLLSSVSASVSQVL